MPGLFIAFSPRLIESWGGAHIEIVKLLLYFLHFECGGEGGAVLVLTQSRPVHLVVGNSDLPPLAVLHSVVYPAVAEQIAVYEVFVQRVFAGHPIIAVLYIIDIGAVGLILPAVLLPVIKD